MLLSFTVYYHSNSIISMILQLLCSYDTILWCSLTIVATYYKNHSFFLILSSLYYKKHQKRDAGSVY